MPLVNVQNIGAIGVNKDLSAHDMPINAWTDAQNIRFLDGYASQFYGHGQVYGDPVGIPQHVLSANISGARYWIYLTSNKAVAVTNSAGITVATDITHVTPHAGVVNKWTSTMLSGIPILNVGDGSKVPMSWDLNLGNKFIDLPAWDGTHRCESIRAYKNYLVALNITKGANNYPFMVKWSHPADPGSLPSSWDETDPLKDAGQVDLAEGHDQIIDGLQLRDSFMIYKENSIWRMDYTGGQSVFRFSKVLGTSGALNKNCIVEADGFHVVLTGSDVIAHDGQSATSVMDKQTRRYLFQNIDVDNSNKCFVFKNPFFNEIFVCYPEVGMSSCNKAMVWNFKDKTVSFRDIPNLNHANMGTVDNTLNSTFDSDSAPFDSDLTLFDGGDFTPSTVRVLMASNDNKLFMLDASSSFDGAMPVSKLERKGLSFGAADKIKLVSSIRPRIVGSTSYTVLIQVGWSNDPYDEPTWCEPMTHTIGETISNDCFVSGRYIAIRFLSGTGFQWRLDSYTIDIQEQGSW